MNIFEQYNIKIKNSTDGGVLLIQYPNEAPMYFNNHNDLVRLCKITGLPIRKIDKILSKTLNFESYSSIKFEIERKGKNTGEVEKLKQKYNLQDVSFLYEFVKARALNQRNFHAINLTGRYKECLTKDICYMSMDTDTASISNYMKSYLKIKFIWLILSNRESNFKKLRILDTYYQIPNVILLGNKPTPYCDNIEINQCNHEIIINKENLWYEVLTTVSPRDTNTT